jgi:hypothetical protein
MSQVTVYSAKGSVVQRVHVADPVDGSLLTVRSVSTGVNGIATRDTDLRALGEDVRDLVLQLRALAMAAGLTSDPLTTLDMKDESNAR